MNPAVAIGFLASAVTAWWYLSAPGRSLTTGWADVSSWLTGELQLSASQKDMAAIITDEFARAGLSWMTVAAIANAYAESRLDPQAIGDSGAAVGLFQVHPWGGTTAERQDPRHNCRAILSDHGIDELAQYRGRSTHAELAYLFATLVERCAKCGSTPGASDADAVERRELVTKLFGPHVAATVP